MSDHRRGITVRIDRALRHDSEDGLGGLRDVLLRKTAPRLALFCAVGAVTWTIGVLMSNALRPASIPTAFPWPGNLIGAIMVAVLGGSFAYFMRPKAGSDEPAVYLGFGLLIINAFAIATLNEWVPTFPDHRYVSWNTIAILTYAIVVPSSPFKMFVACLVAATMDPLAVGIANLRGFSAPGMFQGILLYYPNYICAVIAVVPSIALHHMERRISSAQELGSYQLAARLGTGGMGEVWRAEHRLLHRPAAIKLVRPEILGVANEREARLLLRRFVREAQATAVLDSPHTIDLFDFGLTEEGAFYYVMELLIGRDLESLVRDFGAQPSDRVGYVMRQVCHSLAEAHSRGLVHRDIKPANVYVCRMGLDYDFVKVLDFGLVKYSTGHARSTLLTNDQITSGTPAYMAPEVILGETQVDARADVYSLGCVAYWLLTGHLVFEENSVMKMLIAHLETAPVPPSRRTELPISNDLDQLVLACLEKDAGRRPQNAEVLWQMSLECKGAETWSQAAARQWWKTHLPELTHPATLAMPAAAPDLTSSFT